jgi:hypothetical protein
MQPVNPEPGHYTKDKKNIIGLNPADEKVYLWDVESKKIIKEFLAPGIATHDAKIYIDPTGKRIVVAPPLGKPIRIFDVATGSHKDIDLLAMLKEREKSKQSLVNKVLQSKMTKLFGICALGAGIVGGIGYLIWKFFGKPKENKPNTK